MRFHLMTVEGAQQFGETWKIAPSVPLQSFLERAPKLMMPMAGEELELRLSDERVAPARIASFGVDAWKDSDGNLCVNTDPSGGFYLTLTITGISDASEVAPRTEIWLSNARLGA